jgi:hypothetical protein
MNVRGFAIAGLLLLAACASSNMPRFTTDAAPGFNVAEVKSYSWAFQNAPTGMNPLQYQRIRDAMDAAFAANGFQRVEDGGDVIVGFTIGARDRVEVTDWGPVGPYFPGLGRSPRSAWAYTYNRVDVRNVTQGSLALDVFDARTRQPVWHGIAARDLSSSGASQELIANAVDGLVSRFAGVAK